MLVGILNFGLGEAGIKKTFVLYLAAFVVHFAETKFVTPRVLGHRISFTSFAVITVLVGSVLALGIGRGILAGLFLLVALKSLVEIADEGRAVMGRRDKPDRAPAPDPAPQAEAGAATRAMPMSHLSMGDRKHRRGRK